MGQFLDENESTQSVRFEDGLLSDLWDDAEEFTGIGGLVVDGVEDLFRILEANQNTVTIEDKQKALKAIEDAYRGWHDIKEKYDKIRDSLREMEYRITNLRRGGPVGEAEEDPEDIKFRKEIARLNKEYQDFKELAYEQEKDLINSKENMQDIMAEIDRLEGRR